MILMYYYFNRWNIIYNKEYKHVRIASLYKILRWCVCDSDEIYDI